jgi:hypothetical protein
MQQSSEMLKKINIYGVNDQTGEKIGLGVSGPVSSTNNSTTDRRQPTSVTALDSNKYTCNKVNADTLRRTRSLMPGQNSRISSSASAIRSSSVLRLIAS